MDNSEELIKDLNKTCGLQLAEYLSADQLEALLAEKFNDMIRDQFSALVQFLYRMDVSEARLRDLLKSSGEDAGMIIARLVIERQQQKILTRRQYKAGDACSGEERW